MSKSILLVHGAGHGAWCWEHETRSLVARGWNVTAIDLPGLGADRTPAAEVRFDDYVGAISRALRNAVSPVTVVGHSMGGMPMSAAAELVPERVRNLIYLASLLPKIGESVGDLAATLRRFDGPSAFDILQECEEPGAHGFDIGRAAQTFYNRCSPDIAARAVERLRPQALRPLQADIPLSPARFGALRKAYVVCTRDQALPVGAQRFFCERSPDVIRYELDADHSPFYSDPEGLAEIIDCEYQLCHTDRRASSTSLANGGLPR